LRNLKSQCYWESKMPKKIITEKTLPLALYELDKWSGKLTWNSFAKQLAKVLGEEKISRHTLLSYPSLVEAFNDRKNSIKESSKDEEKDITLDFAKQQIATLEATVERLEKQNEKLLEQFVRWQHNAYMMPNVDMKLLNKQLDKPLPEVDRR
jgi:predicted RNase H-like nuclease (RuvC/YqgF family)